MRDAAVSRRVSCGLANMVFLGRESTNFVRFCSFFRPTEFLSANPARTRYRAVMPNIGRVDWSAVSNGSCVRRIFTITLAPSHR